MEMEAIYRIMSYQKQDILDTIESTLAPHIKIALDSRLPQSISMFKTPLPPNNEKFKDLVTKCTTISCEFNLFIIQSDSTISCQFNFYQQYTTLVVVAFELMQKVDLKIMQKHLK